MLGEIQGSGCRPASRYADADRGDGTRAPGTGSGSVEINDPLLQVASKRRAIGDIRPPCGEEIASRGEEQSGLWIGSERNCGVEGGDRVGDSTCVGQRGRAPAQGADSKLAVGGRVAASAYSAAAVALSTPIITLPSSKWTAARNAGAGGSSKARRR